MGCKSASLPCVDVLGGRALRRHAEEHLPSCTLGKDGDYLWAELLNLWSMNDLLVAREVFSFRFFFGATMSIIFVKVIFLNVKLFWICGFTANKCRVQRRLLYVVSSRHSSGRPDLL